MSISIEALKEAIQIKESIQKLEARLGKILGDSTVASLLGAAPVKRGRGRKRSVGRPPKAPKVAAAAKPGRKKRGKLSAEGRARIIAAQKARWAKAGASAPAKAAAPAKKKKNKLSAEGRAKIIAAQKARWAAAKKAKK